MLMVAAKTQTELSTMRRRNMANSQYPDWCARPEYSDLVNLLASHGGSLPWNENTSMDQLNTTFDLSPPSLPSTPYSSDIENSECSRGPSPEYWSLHEDPDAVHPISPPRHQFLPNLVRIFEPSHIPQDAIHCIICGPSSLIRSSPMKSACKHYTSCSECQSRIVRQLLRCGKCCRDLTQGYPVCNDLECESTSKRMARVLQTTQCPRCGDKLAKETCNPSCTRKNTELFNQCRQQLTTAVAALVVSPNVCATLFPGSRPCCHYARCELHGAITRGRSNRCPDCREVSRSGRSGITRMRLPIAEQPLPVVCIINTTLIDDFSSEPSFT